MTKTIKTQIQFIYEWKQREEIYDRIDEHREALDEYAEREIASHFEKGFTSGFLELEIDEIFYDGYWARNTVRLAEPHQKTNNE